MRVRGAAATFDVGTFIWSGGAFELTGTWHDADGLGRARLLIEIDGIERNIGAARGKQAEDGPGWTARFLSAKQPDPGTAATLLAGDARIELPPPVVSDAPPPPPPPAAEEPDSDTELLQALRAEREALEDIRRRLADERHAAERVLRELEDRPSPPPARRGLSKRPEQQMAEQLDYTPLYWVCGVVAFLFLLVLIWIV